MPSEPIVMPAIVAASVMAVPAAETPRESEASSCHSTSQERAATPPNATAAWVPTRRNLELTR